MRVISDIKTLRPNRPALLTIGKFDGVHRGHQHMITELVARARATGAQSVVLTFDPHPDEILRPERAIRYLTTPAERAELIAALGADLLLILPFDAALAQLTAAEFMGLICAHLNLRELWIGPDFRLGHKAQGDAALLRTIGADLGYTVHPVAWWTLDGETVSSTGIRELLGAGQVEAAARYLGRPFHVQGQVVGGDQRGRTIGFPTANLALPANHVLPADGVYACRAAIVGAGPEQLPAVTNIGVRPTFGAPGRTVEAHLLDWRGDLYGATLRLEFAARLRGEQRFAGIEPLVAQIQRDVVAARLLLDSSPS